MKTAFYNSSFCLRFAACICALLCLVGCATHRVDWAARIGHYTFDQAVLEMGPPDNQAKLTDGSIVAEWLQYRGTTYVYGSPAFPWPYYAGTTIAQTTPSSYLRLTFGPDGQLKAWKKVYR